MAIRAKARGGRGFVRAPIALELWQQKRLPYNVG
jgi:hypothetical protein